MEKKIKCVCQYCNKEFEIVPSRLKHGRGKHCSRDCQYAAIKTRPPKNGKKFNCLNCNKPFFLTISILRSSRKGIGKYCSRKCRDTHRIGKNHPQFIDGNGVNYHGPNWYSQRRKALKRDNNTCQDCGITKEDSVKKFSQPLAVHHIIPFRLFNDNYSQANQLENLVTLCHSCHRKIESKIRLNEIEINGVVQLRLF